MSKYVNVDPFVAYCKQRGLKSAYQVYFELSRQSGIDICFCKDCKHNPKYTEDYAHGECPFCCEDDCYSGTPDDDFYCKRGERRRV